MFRMEWLAEFAELATANEGEMRTSTLLSSETNSDPQTPLITTSFKVRK